MEKLTLERFREIKQELNNLVEQARQIASEYENKEEEIRKLGLNKDEERKRIKENDKNMTTTIEGLGEKAEEFIDEIQNSNLSGIPFEEYSDFVMAGEIDYSGTSANLDFEIIGFTSYVRAKGCNVKNVDLSSLKYDGNSFDIEFMRAHPKDFLPEAITDEEVKSAFYYNHLSLDLVKKYNLSDLNIYDRLDKDSKLFVDKLGLERCMQFDEEVLFVLKERFRYPDIQEEQLETEESINKLIIERARKIASLDSEWGRYNSSEYDKLSKSSQLRALLPRELICFKEEQEELRKKFHEQTLTITDVIENFEVFKGKKYCNQLDYQQRSPLIVRGVKEEEIDFFIENHKEMALYFANVSMSGFANLADGIKYSMEKQEDVQKGITRALQRIATDLNPAYLDDWYQTAKDFSRFGSSFEQVIDCMDSGNIRVGGAYQINEGLGKKVKEIVDTIGEEKFRSYNIPFNLINKKDVYEVFKTYGIETIMQFDKENGGIFSDNDYEFLRGMFKAYLQWSMWEAKEDLVFKQSENGEKVQYSKEEFEEVIRRMIIYYKPQKGRLPYEKIQGSFREKNQDLYISEDAPEELQKAFYEKNLTFSLIQKYPEYTEQLVKVPEVIKRFGLNRSDTIFSKFTVQEILELVKRHGEQIDRIGGYILNRDISYEKMAKLFDEGFNDEFLKGILTKEINSVFIKENEENIRRVAALGIDIGMFCNYQLQDVWRYVESAYGRQETTDLEILFELSRNYPKYIEEAWRFSQKIDYISKSREKAMQTVADLMESTILQGEIVYGEDAPKFMKEKHPELFLSEDAPYELKCKYYNCFGNNYPIKFEDILKYKDFLKGKNLSVIGHVNFVNLFKKFSLEEVLDFITIEYQDENGQIVEGIDEKVVQGLNLIMDGGLEQIQKFKKFLVEKTEYFARKELLEINKIDSSTLDFIVSGEKEDERTLNLYNNKKEKFTKAILKNPGVMIYYPQEELDKFNFGEYEELKHLSRFEDGAYYRFSISEQIISTMYAYLGFKECKEILKLPELSEEEIQALRQANQEIFNQVYEIRYDIGGNLKPTNEFFNRLLPMIQGKKNVLKVYKSLNQKITEGTASNLEQLIIECFEGNGISLNTDKIKLCATSTIKKHTSVKMEQLDNLLKYQMTENIQETPENRKILKDILTNSLRNSFNANEKIDIEQIRNEIQTEFERTKEDGTTFYSEHVTSHLEDLMQIVEHLNNRKFEVKLNQSFIELLGEEKEKIGERWIAKLASVPEDATKEELEEIEKRLYGEEVGYYIRAARRIELRDKSEKGEAEAYEYLRSHQDTWAFTEIQGEQMFAGLSYPFSEAFKKFYIANRREILRNPEYYTKFQRMHSEFDGIIEKPEIKNRFEAGKFTIEQLITELEHITYSGVKEGEEELEYKARKSGLEREYFKTAQKIFEEMKKREYQTIPQEEVLHKRFRGRILRLDDPLQLFMGNITTCCQQLGEGQPGETSMIHSATEENGAVFVVEEIDEFGNVTNVVAQSWVWRNGNTACFDNVEIPDNLAKHLREIGAYDEIFKIYQETAARMIETDAKTMKKLLEHGKITQEQYDSLVLRDITVGTGCDDLIKNISDEQHKKLEKAKEIKLPKEINKKYQGVEERDKGLYSDARVLQYILAKNDEVYDKAVDGNLDIVDIPLKYTRIREVVRREGFEIHSEMFKRIKQMTQNSQEVEHIISDEMEGLYDFIEEISDDSDNYNKDKLSVSISENDDWYILLEETEDAITILDSAIVTKEDSEKERDTIDKKMALMEYTRELYIYLKKASMTSKSLQLNLEREGKFSNLQALIDEGIISVEGSSIAVNNIDELEKRLESIEKAIEAERRERLTLGEEQADTSTKERRLIEESAYGISDNTLEFVKSIEDKAYPEEMKTMQDMKNIEDLVDIYGDFSSGITIARNNDWYIIYGENDNSIEILDIASLPNRDKNASRQEMYNYITNVINQKARIGKKLVELYAKEDTSYIMIQKMVHNGEYEILEDVPSTWESGSSIKMHNLVLRPIIQRDRGD